MNRLLAVDKPPTDAGEWLMVNLGKQRYIVGTWCPRGSGHFDLINSPDYDGSCGTKGWPLIIEVDDDEDPGLLPDGYFEDEQ